MYIYRITLRIRYYWSLKWWKARLSAIIANTRLHWRLFFIRVFSFGWFLSDHGKLKILLLINLSFRLPASARKTLAGLSLTVWELIVGLYFLFGASFSFAGVLVCLRQILWEGLTSLRELLLNVPKLATLCRILALVNHWMKKLWLFNRALLEIRIRLM